LTGSECRLFRQKVHDLLPTFNIGDPVVKTGGDYRFEGEVVALFIKRSGQVRCVVEDDRGVLHIFSPKQLTSKDRR
jgi:hypothetical protein